ncbi:hypothetical protein SAMN02745883_02053 [Caminicella sporogenes DSM 14501]|uniref:Uncharacterized protein n=1 Tax=Caminicella sporogenes DSM 14501 TaxID=1121266 RepID=A0A1M6SGI1_9FIRM|nr:hypothetical protein [Caminicella sporogenes]RKD26652.1 hypothetical protein BET04_10220 [Caminicella sporogenes]WIF95962.1 hypothetical protein QNI18_04975 [Caminicella sporogenes]SHK43894.1 hypothetical protein SAMN02745883_02053 [Caminicella sporogenes DSM 14501]
MKNLRLLSQNAVEVNISSEDIKNMIESFESVEEVRDISDMFSEEVLGYDINLNGDYIEMILKEQLENFSFDLDDEISEILFEQAQYIGDIMVDNLKEYIEDRYRIEDFQSAYDVYKADINEGIGLTLTLSFGKVKHGKLYELASNFNKNSGLR